RVSDADPTTLHEACPRAPRALSEVVRRLLEKHPKDRFQTASELAAVLKQQLAAANAAQPEGGDRHPVARRVRPPQAPTAGLLAAAAALGLAAALVVGSRWRGPRADVAPRSLVAASPSRPPSPSPSPAAKADGPWARVITVGREGPAAFRTINEAIDA